MTVGLHSNKHKTNNITEGRRVTWDVSHDGGEAVKLLVMFAPLLQSDGPHTGSTWPMNKPQVCVDEGKNVVISFTVAGRKCEIRQQAETL